MTMTQHWWKEDSEDNEESVGSLDTKQLNVVQQSTPIIRGRIMIKKMENSMESVFSAVNTDIVRQISGTINSMKTKMKMK